MIKILNEAIYDEFMHLVDSSKKDIKLCAPFIKENVINDIFTYKKYYANIATITNIRLMSFSERF